MYIKYKYIPIMISIIIYPPSGVGSLFYNDD